MTLKLAGGVAIAAAAFLHLCATPATAQKAKDTLRFPLLEVESTLRWPDNWPIRFTRHSFLELDPKTCALGGKTFRRFFRIQSGKDLLPD